MMNDYYVADGPYVDRMRYKYGAFTDPVSLLIILYTHTSPHKEATQNLTTHCRSVLHKTTCNSLQSQCRDYL